MERLHSARISCDVLMCHACIRNRYGTPAIAVLRFVCKYSMVDVFFGKRGIPLYFYFMYGCMCVFIYTYGARVIHIPSCTTPTTTHYTSQRHISKTVLAQTNWKSKACRRGRTDSEVRVPSLGRLSRRLLIVLVDVLSPQTAQFTSVK